MTTLKKNKVVLGLSGGVDSTAAALLLQEKGYDVTGLYFDIREQCGSGRETAAAAAEQLGIDFIYRNVAHAFDETVIGNFCSEYECGRTPNPCIICNPMIKFKVLLDAADEIGAYHIATGHYADTYHDEHTDMWYIRRAANKKKDQSYMLYRLGQEAISRLLLPLNEIEDKEQVRELARGKALKNSEAKDSQEICFIDADDNYKDFLERRGVKSVEGNFVDSDGNAVGRHKGILNYTIGQRKGLGIALGKPAFVTAIDCESNTVVLGSNEELFSREVISDNNVINGISIDNNENDENDEAASVCIIGKIEAKIRYAAKPASASIEFREDGSILTTFDEPQRAATPGQSIVFYRDDLVIGGGFIKNK
ncbi:MAG: tRNA 2-thiouridine(34) synthase MnmA [Firmicutes bacterium]|nr:tRNA 2-thiouridine(34) synthase MnmA [Bacillota bacterium]